MYEIEQGVKIPETSRRSKYPWGKMKVGDSFFVPTPKETNIAAHSTSIRAAGIRTLGKGMTTVKVVTENGVEGVRAWRIK